MTPLTIPGLAVAPRTRKGWWRLLWHGGTKAMRRVLQLDDTPYRIAIGCACGICSSTLPIFGQMFIGMALAKLLRGSVLASLPWTWITNPVTTLPIWYGGYCLGLWLMPGDQVAIGYDAMMQRLSAFDQAGWEAGWSMMGTTLLTILAPLWLGTAVMGIALAIPSGLAVHALVSAVQRRRTDRRRQWSLNPTRTSCTEISDISP